MKTKKLIPFIWTAINLALFFILVGPLLPKLPAWLIVLLLMAVALACIAWLSSKCSQTPGSEET